jgi:tRNA modification GTPase
VPEGIEEPVPDGVPVTIVRNKIDLSGDTPGIVGGDRPVVQLAAKTGEGLDALRKHIRDLAGFRDLGEGAFTARRRHVEALREAQKRFEAGRTALQAARAGELLAEELRLSQQALGTITGEFTPDDLLGRIFSEFCIGK